MKRLEDKMIDFSKSLEFEKAQKIKEKLDFSDKLLRMDEVLSDIGMHKESKHLKEIIKELWLVLEV